MTNRIQWPALPATVVTAIETELGSPVTAAHSATDGYSATLAATVEFAHRPRAQRIHVREAGTMLTSANPHWLRAAIDTSNDRVDQGEQRGRGVRNL